MSTKHINLKNIKNELKTNVLQNEGKMKKQKMPSSLMILGLVTASLLVLTNCTKKVDYETIPGTLKKESFSKDLFDTNAEYLMAASQQESSRSASDAFPFLAGDNKRVKLEIGEKSIRIIETEKDERFASNETNAKLVLEIPIRHIKYHCAKDKYGNCTNKEEDDLSLDWTQKDTVQIQFEAARSGQLDMLPIMSSQTYGENCYEEVSSRLLKSEVEENAINFQVKRTFKTKLECVNGEGASSMAELTADANISAIYHYSLVKLNSILSKDYKTISYPVSSKDESTFGFFSTSRTQLDADNNNTDKSVIQIMNRWNPNRKEIVYYLSDEFAKPENKLVKDLTYKTVGNINMGLETAGVNFRINLQEPAGKVPGDIRNSMIVLVEDPVASSVIGYGPQTEDPKTGEIISARTVMFLGTIKKFVKYTYDDIIREKKNALLEAKKSVKSAAPVITMAADIMAETAAKKSSGKTYNLDKMNAQVLAKINAKPIVAGTQKITSAVGASTQKSQIQKALKNYTANRNGEFSGKDLKSKINYLQFAKNCAFSPNAEAVSGSISKKLVDQFPADAKPWADLSASEKEAAIAIILPEIWVPTLIHEMGHNLGLRHNFQGSEDKANFYSNEELVKNNIDHAVVSSSVMEYIEDLKALPILGKYDIAALKFGYLRQVEVVTSVSNDGAADVTKTETKEITTTLQNLIADLTADLLKNNPKLDPTKIKVDSKDYGFCTDEHLGQNAGCKQFDYGTSYTDIVKNMINDYEEAYSKRNLRNGRANMSLFDDLTYASRIKGIFTDLRIMMEVAERLKYRFNLVDSSPEWESVEWLKDLKTATLLGGQFMAGVMLVPDTTCAIAATEKPTEIIAVMNLNEIDPDAISCFKAKLNEKYLIVGQAGKSFNSKKDQDSTNNYADQIDVRGIWIDKLIAARTLMNRQIGIFSMDKKQDSFLNVTELRGGILDAVSGILTDNVVAKVPFTLLDGSKVEFEIGYDLSNTQVIEKSIHPMIARRLGISETGTTMLQQVVANVVAANAKDTSGVNAADNTLADAVSIHRLSDISDTKLGTGTQSVMIDNIKHVATKSNTFAFDAINNLTIARVLDLVAPEKIQSILDLRKGGQRTAPADAKPEELIVWKMPTQILEAYLNQVIKSSDFYMKLLRVLPAI